MGKEEQGFKYNGMAVISEEKDRRPYKKKSEKMETGMQILEEYGIQNSKEVLEELLEKMKGSPVQETKIKIKEIKKK